MTPADVRVIHASEIAKGKSAKDAYHGTRTLVQLALHEASPSPYRLPPPKKVFFRREPTDEEKSLAAASGIEIRVGIELTTGAEADGRIDRPYRDRHDRCLGGDDRPAGGRDGRR
jgi:hypothetical protein